MNTETPDQRYQLITKAIEYVVQHQWRQPSLSELAAHLRLSEFHLQRLFSAWAGVSPKQYLQYLTKENAKQRLRSSTVLDTALALGLSGSSRLHDLMVSCEGVTPGEFKDLGQGLTIHYGSHPTPFGSCLLATTERGICKLAFYDHGAELSALEQELHHEWPAARIVRNEQISGALIADIFPDQMDERLREHGVKQSSLPLKLLLKGSRFQLKVWEALLAIPPGEICSYQHIAGLIGAPDSSRAVASAVARNHVGYLIPCHRVIRASGEFNAYRWGRTRKQALIAWEACQTKRSSLEH